MPFSIKLQQALNSGKIRIRKIVGGEVIVRFTPFVVVRNGKPQTIAVKNIAIPHSNALDLHTVDNITPEAIAHSNLDSLILQGCLEIL